MDQITTALKSVLRPVQSLYNQAFNANKYAAGIGLSVIITTSLFFFTANMVVPCQFNELIFDTLSSSKIYN